MKTLKKNFRVFATLAACAGILALSSGCANVTRATPRAGTVINANMSASDYEVLGTTEGKSTKTSYFLGTVQVIDGDKYRILGIRFFEDQFAFSDTDRSWFSGVSTADRAYYKALAATPDADAVAYKASIETKTGIPLIWYTTEVTYVGKALKYKVHN